MYTVKQLSKLAGVSVRTLHYYDEIGLLKPSLVGENGYRYYAEEGVFRLQQVLFFRELGLGLAEIGEVLADEGFDLVTALQLHRRRLEEKVRRLHTLMETVDKTILHLVGELNMSKKTMFAGFSEEKLAAYEQEARQLYGEESVSHSVKLWASYGKEKQEAIKQEGGAIYQAIAAHMAEGAEAESAVVQALIARWHDHLRYFYEPSREVLAGLGNAYFEHPDFHATFAAIDPVLPSFLQKAIAVYVAQLA